MRTTWKSMAAGLAALASVVAGLALLLLLATPWVSPWLKERVAQRLEQRLQHPVAIERLELSLFPPGFVAHELTVGRGETPPARVAELGVRLDPWALLRLAPVARGIRLTEPRIHIGSEGLALPGGGKGGNGGLRQVSVSDGRITYHRSGWSEPVNATLETASLRLPPEGGPELQALGQFEGAPFEVELHAGEAIALDARVAKLSVRFQGRAEGGLRAAGRGIELRGRLHVEGAPASVPLAPFTTLKPEVTLVFTGALAADAGRWHATDLELRAAESTLTGSARLDTTGRPWRVQADLQVPRLNPERLADLWRRDGPAGALPLGQLPHTEVEISLAELPLFGLQLAPATVSASAAPGRLRLVGESHAAEGRFQAVAEARDDGGANHWQLNAELADVALQSLLPEDPLEGELRGRVRGRFEGELRRERDAALLATVQGNGRLAMTDGAIQRALVERLNLELTQFLFGGDKEMLPVECALAHWRLDNRQLAVEALVLQTPDALITGGGTLGLERMQLDGVLRADRGGLTVGALPGHVQVGGTLSQPSFSLGDDAVAKQVLESIALGALAGPLGAVLSLVEIGDQAPENACGRIAQRLAEGEQD